MTTIVTREVGATAKGSPLTNAEVDGNFINLNTAKIEADSVHTLTNKILDSYTNKIGADHVHFKVKATAAVTKGQLLKVTGYNQGEDAIEVQPWSAQPDVAVAIAHESLSVGSFGLALHAGVIDGLNTSSFSVGQVLYPAAAGGLTSVKPSGSYQAVAFVLKSNANNGALLVEFSEPTPVLATVATSGLFADLLSKPTSISGYGITMTSSDVTTALGYTPYNATNPDGYITSSALSSYLPLSGGTLSGSLLLHSTGGSSGFYNGTGDGATYSTYNFLLRGWNGMAFQNPTSGGSFPNSITGVLDFREGTLDMKGGFKVNGSTVLHAGNYNSYSPTLTGGGASGTWGINVTGSAGDIGGYTSDGWLRKVADNTQFKMYGNSHTMIYRTDGTTNPHGGGGYAHIFYYGGSNDNHRMFIINTDGRLYSPYHGWLDQMSIAGSAGSANDAYVLVREDNRSVSPNELAAGRLKFGFVSWDNNNGGEYADFLHLRSYTDSSGGPDNLVMFKKNGIGMRIWQQDFGSSTRYTSYVDVLHSGNYNSYSPTLTGGGASGTWGINITGNAATATSSPLVSAVGTYSWSASTLPASYSLGIQSSFVRSNEGFPDFGSVMTMNTYSGGGGALQLYVPYSPTYGGNQIRVRFGNYDVSNGNSWTSWKYIITNDTILNYSPSLSGVGAGGTWGIRITGFANAGSQRLYSTDSAYNYDAANPYYGYLTYNSGANRWRFKVSPATPDAVEVAYADAAGSASNSSTVGGLAPAQFFNNMGNNHNTYTEFNAVPGFGAYYVQQGGQSPTGTATHQWYGFTLGLGNEYAFSSYASQIYWPRAAQNSETYIYIRDREGGVWDSWRKIRSGQSDFATTATSAGYINSTQGSDSAFYALLYNTLSGNLNAYNNPGLYSAEYTGGTNNPAGATGQNGHFIQISDAGGTDVKTQWYFHNNKNNIYMRLMWGNNSWGAWKNLLHDGNYTSYSPSLTGSGASGTWGIGITGSVNGIYFNQYNASNPRIYSADAAGDMGLLGVNSSGVFKWQIYGNGSSYGFLDGAWASWDLKKDLNGALYINGYTALHAGNYTSYSHSIATSDSRYVRKDTTGQFLKPYYEYGSYLTSETPANLKDQMSGGGLRVDFMNPSYTGSGNWNHVITFSGYNMYNMYQLGGNYDGGTGTDLYVRSEANHGGTSWTAWRRLLNSSNYNSYSPSLTGSGASGTWGISITGNAGSLQGYYWNSAGKDVRGSEIYTDGWLRNYNSGTGLYNQATSNHWYSDGQYWNVGMTGSTRGIRLRNGHAGTTLGYLYAEDNQNMGLLNSSGNWAVQVYPGGTGGGNLAGTWTIGGNTPLTSANYTSYAISNGANFRVGVLTFNGEGGDSGNGSVAHSYGIYQQGGSWTYPYPDLCIGFHTGIKIGAHYNYGGTRFYNNSDWATQIMSIGESDNNVRINNTLYSYAYRGNSNVAGTGEATYHPAGIYSTGNNWLYGTIYTNGNGIYASGAYSEVTAYRANRANGNFYIDDNYGNGIVGVYASTRYQGVFFMGDSYKMSADGTSLANMYGIGWSHPNAGGAAGNLTDHGMLIINNGSFRCAISNSIVASANITAYSDERLKTNWRSMPENFVARLAQVRVGIYDRTDEEGVTQVGVSAQSLQPLLPEAIMTAKDDMQTLSVSYGNAALASAVELAKDNVELRARIERLESIINNLLGVQSCPK